MMKTVLLPTKPRIFEVCEDDGPVEQITANDYIAAFCRWYRLEVGDPKGIEVELSGGTSGTMYVWVGDKMYKVRDVTQFEESDA